MQEISRCSQRTKDSVIRLQDDLEQLKARIPGGASYQAQVVETIKANEVHLDQKEAHSD